MKVALIVSIVAVVGAAGLPARSDTPKSISVVLPGEERWREGTGRDRGAQLAVLTGKPSAAGLYVFRVHMPARFIFSPHVHNAAETATVLSGTLLLGFGGRIEPQRALRLPAGSFVKIPAGVVHYWIAETPAVLQAAGIGPRTTTAK